MSFSYDNKVYRNLEEQVLHNKERIEAIESAGVVVGEFGIKVKGVLASWPSPEPTASEYGEAYLVGVNTYNLYIWTRGVTQEGEDGWLNIGQFPQPGPQGETGEQGETGPQGATGSTGATGNGISSASVISVIDTELYTENIVQLTFTNGTTQNILVKVKKGAKGETGETGPQGTQGIQGPQGPAFNIQAHLESTSQLPTPTYELQQQGIAYTINEDASHQVTEAKHLWVIQGSNDNYISCLSQVICSLFY